MRYTRSLGLLFSLSALASASVVTLAAPAAHAFIPCDQTCGGGHCAGAAPTGDAGTDGAGGRG